MNEHASVASGEKDARQGVLRKYWWLLALVVLILLVAAIYLLSHLSAADSEMYPTTMLEMRMTTFQLC